MVDDTFGHEKTVSVNPKLWLAPVLVGRQDFTPRQNSAAGALGAPEGARRVRRPSRPRLRLGS